MQISMLRVTEPGFYITISLIEHFNHGVVHLYILTEISALNAVAIYPLPDVLERSS